MSDVIRINRAFTHIDVTEHLRQGKSGLLPYLDRINTGEGGNSHILLHIAEEGHGPTLFVSNAGAVTVNELDHLFSILKKNHQLLSEDIHEFNKGYAAEWERKNSKLYTQATTHSRVPTTTKTKIAKEIKGGYVYLMHLSSGVYKIGISTDPKARLKQLKRGSTIGPYELLLVSSVYTSNPYEYEDELHTKFDDQNVLGEWFDLSDEQVSELLTEWGNIRSQSE